MNSAFDCMAWLSC